MRPQRLKLKQASAVLQVQPKELQNLVQFGVVKPKRSEGTYLFDTNALLTAKVALYLKASLGTKSSVLSKLMNAFATFEEQLKSENPRYVVFTFSFFPQQEPLKLGVPFRSLGEQIQERIKRTHLYKDLPRGRKRRGWKKEFLESLSLAAKDLGDLSKEDIFSAVRSYRRERRSPEITVAAER